MQEVFKTKPRKAEAMSINLIIVAAIALVVMIILVMIFTGNIGKWRKSTESCASKRGVCVEDTKNADGQYTNCLNDYWSVMPYECDEGKICCLKQLQ